MTMTSSLRPASPGGFGRAMLGARMSVHEQRFELLADLGAMIAG